VALRRLALVDVGDQVTAGHLPRKVWGNWLILCPLRSGLRLLVEVLDERVRREPGGITGMSLRDTLVQ
jgi:hypothetical protein